MNTTKVPVREDTMLQLHNLGKKEQKSLAVLVDELIQAGLERRAEDEAAKLDCPF